jgi:hypothetical protein
VTPNERELQIEVEILEAKLWRANAQILRLRAIEEAARVYFDASSNDNVTLDVWQALSEALAAKEGK